MNYLNLQAIARRFDAARDRRQAMRKVIDTESDPGAWAEALRYVQFPVRDHDSLAEQSMRRLALRKAARREKNPHKRGHITRAINAGAV